MAEGIQPHLLSYFDVDDELIECRWFFTFRGEVGCVDCLIFLCPHLCSHSSTYLVKNFLINVRSIYLFKSWVQEPRSKIGQNPQIPWQIQVIPQGLFAEN